MWTWVLFACVMQRLMLWIKRESHDYFFSSLPQTIMTFRKNSHDSCQLNCVMSHSNVKLIFLFDNRFISSSTHSLSLSPCAWDFAVINYSRRMVLAPESLLVVKSVTNILWLVVSNLCNSLSHNWRATQPMINQLADELHLISPRVAHRSFVWNADDYWQGNCGWSWTHLYQFIWNVSHFKYNVIGFQFIDLNNCKLYYS